MQGEVCNYVEPLMGIQFARFLYQEEEEQEVSVQLSLDYFLKNADKMPLARTSSQH
jgi:hypothetical protein